MDNINEYQEYFKQNNSINWKAGIFDYEIIIKYTTDDFMEILNDWLCENCSQNFIVLRNITELVAGGNTQPKIKWEKRKETGPPTYIDNKHNSDTVMDLHVRLHIEDTVLFRLTWVC
jgi:hypothetical protein